MEIIGQEQRKMWPVILGVVLGVGMATLLYVVIISGLWDFIRGNW